MNSDDENNDDTLHLFMEVSQVVRQDPPSEERSHRDSEANSEQDIFQQETQDYAGSDAIFDMATQPMDADEDSEQLSNASKPAESGSEMTQDSSIVSGSQDESDEVMAPPGFLISSSIEYDKASSASPSVSDIRCSFESDNEDFSCPDVDLDCLASQEFPNAPIVIQPTGSPEKVPPPSSHGDPNPTPSEGMLKLFSCINYVYV
jgi:hypothetical protein